MPILLFKLNGVPDDEANEIRDLLSEHRIEYYETPEGRWGISVGGIWLRDDSQLALARELIDNYQQERFSRAREAYELQHKEGRHETLAMRFLRHPLQFIAYVLAILAILYLSCWPFLHWD